MTITWFRAKYEDGTAILYMDTLHGVYLNKASTALVAAFGRDLLIVEGEKDAVLSYWTFLTDSYAYRERRKHTGEKEIYVSHEGRLRVRLVCWEQWYFDREGGFYFGRSPAVQAALNANTPKPTKKRAAKVTSQADA